MASYNPNSVSVAVTMHNTERLRRLAASAPTSESRMGLQLLSEMLDRQVRLQLEKCSAGRRKPPTRSQRLLEI